MAVVDIVRYLKENKALVDKGLKEFFPETNRLFPMMYYSLEGGKRIRPILALTVYRACGGENLEEIMPVACGLELIHTYSLIHDDLPAMDNDDMRRGKRSAHKEYGEANAILAGDGLFAYAFELFTLGNGCYEAKCAVVRAVSRAIGPKGVVFGQVLDVSKDTEPTPRDLRYIHLNKTARFIAVSLECGALMAGAPAHRAKALQRGGVYLGMLFQYTDDILDVVGKKEKLGKTPGKDSAVGKITAPALYGLDGARARARKYAQLANKQFMSLGEPFAILQNITDFILNRSY